MNRHDFMPGCIDPDHSGASRRRRLPTGAYFHKDPGHDHMGRPGPARYAGPSRTVFMLGVAAALHANAYGVFPVGCAGNPSSVDALCTSWNTRLLPFLGAPPNAGGPARLAAPAAGNQQRVVRLLEVQLLQEGLA